MLAGAVAATDHPAGKGDKIMNPACSHYRVKRSCLHNVRVTAAQARSDADMPEGLVLSEELMAAADIAPFEQIIVTKIGGTNWINRMYSFALPGKGGAVEARGAVAHLLRPGDVCCVITGTFLGQAEHDRHLADRYDVPLIDVRLYPEDGTANDPSKGKIVLEQAGRLDRVPALPLGVVQQRRALPRVTLSNLLCGLVVEEVERRGCIEMSAELPMDYMKRAGFCRNQSIFVYNASRGGASAESYVVPSLTKKTVGISGALSAVADVGDVISEVAYVVTTEARVPTICNLSKKLVAAE
jgi:aspartate 1-decarboxylase